MENDNVVVWVCIAAAVAGILIALLSGCNVNTWDPPIPQTRSVGWHKCGRACSCDAQNVCALRDVGCSEWEVCRSDHKCAHVGDPNDPGAGDGNDSINYPVGR